jgi:hypothetical protein
MDTSSIDMPDAAASSTEFDIAPRRIKGLGPLSRLIAHLDPIAGVECLIKAL